MADYPMMLQNGAYIFEVTNGTPLAATKKFVGLRIVPGPRADRYELRATGDQYARGTGTNREWTELSLEGTPSYDEIPALISLFAGAPTITTPAGGTNGRQHQWTGANGTIPAVKSITYEYGDANRGNRIAYVHGTDLTINFGRAGDGVSVGGTLVGQAMTDPFTLSGGATALPFRAIEGVKADAYMDTTFAGIGTTKLTRAAGSSFSLGGILSQFYAMNSAQSSFATVVPNQVEARATIRLGADEVGRPLALGFRTGDRRYFRFEVRAGVNVDTAIALTEYRLTVDWVGEVLEPGDWDEETGLMVVEPTWAVCHDATAGFAWRIQSVNAQTAI